MAHEIGFDPGSPAHLSGLSGENLIQAEQQGQVQNCDDCISLDGKMMEHLDRLSQVLHSYKWRRHCRENIRPGAGIPAGTTYLSQFLAHDSSFTLARSDLFEPSDSGKTTQNILQTPLLLSTLYGRGIHGDKPLYAAPWFRVGEDQLPLFLVSAGAEGVYSSAPSMALLADRRNDDSPILLCITSSFMHFHNWVVDRIKTCCSEIPAEQRFMIARALVVRTWHRIIETDILSRTCRSKADCPAMAELDCDEEEFDQDEDELDQDEKQEGSALMAHAALRCFHSLVLQGYRIRPELDRFSIQSALGNLARGQKLESKRLSKISDWAEKWQPDWAVFFDETHRRVNLTGFTPSFAFRVGEVDIAKRDFIAGIVHGTPTAGGLEVPREAMDRLYRALDIVVADPSFSWESWGKKMPTPAMLGLLADGFFESEIDADGQPQEPFDPRLGPIASALVRQNIQANIDEAESKVRLTLAHAGVEETMLQKVWSNVPPVAPPDSFMEMVQLAKGERK